MSIVEEGDMDILRRAAGSNGGGNAWIAAVARATLRIEKHLRDAPAERATPGEPAQRREAPPVDLKAELAPLVRSVAEATKATADLGGRLAKLEAELGEIDVEIDPVAENGVDNRPSPIEFPDPKRKRS